MKDTMRELNIITHEANAIRTIRGLKLTIELNEKIVEALINLKVTSNFII